MGVESWTVVFFDPESYLEGDPAAAAEPREAARLAREAEQRAGLCEALVRVAAREGYGATTIDAVVAERRLGKMTFYKLYSSLEAGLLEAFEVCARRIYERVTAAAEGRSGRKAKVEAGVAELLEVLSEWPEVARVALVEIRAGGAECREAQQRWLGKFGGLLEGGEAGEEAVLVEIRAGDLESREAQERTLARLEDLVASGGKGREPAVAALGRGRMSAGAMATLLALRLSEERARALPAMQAELVYVGLWPWLGAKAAAEAAGLG